MIDHIIKSFNYELLLSNLNLFKNFLIIYLIIGIIVFSVSMYKIFKKDKIKGYYAFIPFLNLYYYSKIVEIRFWLFLIPISNVVILLASTFLLSDRYGLKKWLCILSIFFPYFFLLYLAFSNKQPRMRIKIEPFVQTNLDIDKLEQKLEHNTNDDFEVSSQSKEVANNFVSTVEEKLNKIEDNAISEDYEDQLYIVSGINNEKKISQDKKKDEVVETLNDDINIIDTFDSNDLRSIGMDLKEKEIEENSKKEVEESDEQKEYEEVGPNVETVAFGGATKNRSVAEVRSESKTEDLKCPNCGSSLVGSNGTCPGCGRDVSKFIFENRK